jgi:hypothetical protein
MNPQGGGMGNIVAILVEFAFLALEAKKKNLTPVANVGKKKGNFIVN